MPRDDPYETPEGVMRHAVHRAKTLGRQVVRISSGLYWTLDQNNYACILVGYTSTDSKTWSTGYRTLLFRTTIDGSSYYSVLKTDPDSGLGAFCRSTLESVRKWDPKIEIDLPTRKMKNAYLKNYYQAHCDKARRLLSARPNTAVGRRIARRGVITPSAAKSSKKQAYYEYDSCDTDDSEP